MDEGITDKKELALTQRLILRYFKFKQFIIVGRIKVIKGIKGIANSSYFPLEMLGILALLYVLLHKYVSEYVSITITDGEFSNFGFATGGVIGASVAIIFSFSTFILQSTADLFSTRYLKRFVENLKEKVIFWLLILSSAASFLMPFLLDEFVFEALTSVLLFAFCLVYILYRDMRERINPEITLKKIRDGAVNELKNINKELTKYANIQNRIFKHNEENKELSLDVQYKLAYKWLLIPLENVKYLYEIGLRLLAKNEINSFNLSVQYIHDIYLNHLHLRAGSFIRVPVSFWGAYTFDDEGFSTGILEYLQSIGDRLIQEQRKESIYFLLRIYESLLNSSLTIRYADKDVVAYKGNPLLNLILAYYIGFIEKLLKSKEGDWIWESINSVSRVSITVLQETNDYSVYSQINRIVSKLSTHCFSEHQELFLKGIVNLYFSQVMTAWNKYESNEIFWDDLFKELRKNIELLSIITEYGFLNSELFTSFQTWQVNVINSIFKIEEENERRRNLDKFLLLLNRWSDFLLNFGRDAGLEDKQLGLLIIQSIKINVRIICDIQKRFCDVDLIKIYNTQFNTLSWYFQKVDKVDDSTLFNLDLVLEILMEQIRNNLEHELFDTNPLIHLYTRLIDQHFEKLTKGNICNQPEVTVKLIYLGLLLDKYKETKQVKDIIAKVEELNNKYLEHNKDFFKQMQEAGNTMGPDEYQLCKEIYDLEQELFSRSRPWGMNRILEKEITKNDWNRFKKKVKFCESVRYKVS